VAGGLKITTGLQRCQELEGARCWLPTSIGLLGRTCTLPECLQNLSFHLQVAAEIAAGGSDADVTKIVADHGQFHTGLEKRDGTTVAEHVWCDVQTAEARDTLRGASDALTKGPLKNNLLS